MNLLPMSIWGHEIQIGPNICLADISKINITCPFSMFVKIIADVSKYFAANIVKDITNIKNCKNIIKSVIIMKF